MDAVVPARGIISTAKYAPALGPLSWFSSAWSSRVLIARLARREIEVRYRGSFLGILWSFVVPILLLSVYTFVFSVIFQARWESPIPSRGHFALLLFTGLIIFNLFSECLNRAPSLMLSNVTYIKKVVFPLEILPWVALVTALFNAVLSFAVLLIGYFALIGIPPLTIFYVPLLLLPYILFTVGVCLFFSSTGVYVRDLQQIIGVVTMMLMFLTPLFYPTTAIPEKLRPYIQYSPLSFVIEEIRGVLFWEREPNLFAWGLFSLASLIVIWLGYAWFMKTKKGFADVI